MEFESTFEKLAWQDIRGLLPEDRIIQALADKKPNVVDEEAWAAVWQLAQQRAANAFGAGRVPAEHADGVRYALRVFVAETLFTRRGFHTDEKNPFTSQGRDQEKFLRKIAEDAKNDENEKGGGTAFTEPMQTATTGLMA